MVVLVTHSFIYSFLAYIELRHGNLSLCNQAASTNCRPAPALQHLVHKWLTSQTSINNWDHIDSPTWLNQSTAQPRHQSSSCLPTMIIPSAVSTNNDDHQLSLPTMMSTNNNCSNSCVYHRRPPTVSTFSDYSTSCLYYFHHLYDHKSVTYDKIIVICYYSYFTSVLFIVFQLSIYHTNNKNNLLGRRSYWPHNSYTQDKRKSLGSIW